MNVSKIDNRPRTTEPPAVKARQIQGSVNDCIGHIMNQTDRLNMIADRIIEERNRLFGPGPAETASRDPGAHGAGEAPPLMPLLCVALERLDAATSRVGRELEGLIGS